MKINGTLVYHLLKFRRLTFFHISDILEIFPPLPHNYAVPSSQLSPYMQGVAENLGIKNENEKLIADLTPKKNYLISAYMLKCYLRAGVKITGKAKRWKKRKKDKKKGRKGGRIERERERFTIFFNVSAISRGIVYRQQPIIADQMKRNQEIRKEYQDKKMSSSADCIKRLSNSLFGKMLEDPRRREKISFVTQKKRYLKLANKANFMGRKIISQNCVLMKNKQTKIAFNKPLFIGKGKRVIRTRTNGTFVNFLIFLSGQQILDYSKGFLFNFIYLHLMPLAVKNQYLLRILYRLENEMFEKGNIRECSRREI